MARHEGRHVYRAAIGYLIGDIVDIGTLEPWAVSTELLCWVEISCVYNTCGQYQAIGQDGSSRETHND